MEYEGNVRSWNEWLDLKKQGYTSVGGNFDCSWNKLTSLKGAPQKVGGNFDCSDNKLTSLEGAPQKVGGSFNCSGNNLTSLKGAPEEVEGSFYCKYTELTSLEGAPKKIGGSFCYDKIKDIPKKIVKKDINKQKTRRKSNKGVSITKIRFTKPNIIHKKNNDKITKRIWLFM